MSERAPAGHLRVGIIGTGRISDLHALEYLAHPHTSIVAVCDLDLSAAQAHAEAWGVPPRRVYADYHELLALADVDAVEILLPHHLHQQVALDAIAAGKHVSLQKPIALTLEGADQVVEAATSSGRTVRVFENFIFYPPIQRAAELVANGEIGEPLSIRLKMVSGDATEAWPVPDSAREWRQDPGRCGGGPMAFDDGLHMYSVARNIFGMPAKIHAWIGATETGAGRVLDTPSIVTMRWADQRVGVLELLRAPELRVSTRHYAEDDRIEITGTRGVVWVNRCHGWLMDEPPVVLFRDRRVTAYSDMKVGFEEGFIGATRDFITAVNDGRRSALTPLDAREILHIALAVQESARVDQAVTL